MAQDTGSEVREELIREAYAVAAAPEKLFDLQVKVAEALGTKTGSADFLAPHIEQVGEIFDQVHFSEEADFADVALGPNSFNGPADEGTAFCVDAKLEVSAGSALEGFTAQEILPDFATGSDADRRKRLARFADGRDPRQSIVLRIHRAPQDDHGAPMAATLRLTKGVRLTDFRKLSLVWDEEAAREFAAGMGLSGAETELVRYLVEGRSLADFSLDRGRSIGTARNQLKATMRKLGVTSQSELVALYAGFAEAWRLRQLGTVGGLQMESGHHSTIALADGSEMPFERFGTPGGMPVLMLHGAIEGPFLTPDLE